MTNNHIFLKGDSFDGLVSIDFPVTGDPTTKGENFFL